MTPRTRRILANTLIAFGILTVAIWQTSNWLRSTILDEEGFTATVAEMIADPAIQSAIAEALASRLNTAGLPNGQVTPEVQRAMERFVASSEFQSTLSRSLVAIHVAVLGTARADAPDAVVIDLNAYQSDLEQLFLNMDPPAPNALPPEGLGVVQVPVDSLPSLAGQVEVLKALPMLALVVGILLFALALTVTNDRPTSLMRIGLGLIMITFIPLAIRVFVPKLAFGKVSDGTARAIGNTVLGSLFGRLVMTAVIVAVIGAVCLAAGLGLKYFLRWKQQHDFMKDIPLAEYDPSSIPWEVQHPGETYRIGSAEPQTVAAAPRPPVPPSVPPAPDAGGWGEAGRRY